MDSATRSSSGDEDGFFNDLNQAPKPLNAADEQPKAKRIACVLCRKRKLRCDGVRPSCGTCTRLSHDCCYDEVRKKSGPKRGYVKQLENRLAQVEELLRGNKDGPFDDMDTDAPPAAGAEKLPQLGMQSMGMEEALPSQDTIDELNRLYFEKIHPTVPAIHPGRFYACMALAPKQRPPLCLRYAMWATVASIVDKYTESQEHFYKRARKYIEHDEMSSHGEQMITVQHVQAWYLLGMLEFRMTFFPRAWMSTGRACRLALMMGLHRIDNAGLDVKQCLPPPRDWIDQEERRRTFWLCFASDRFASIGTGWPMSIDERDIHSNLPSDDENYEKAKEQTTVSLDRALEPGGAMNLSSLAGVSVMAAMFGRNLVHLHRGTPDDNERSLNGKFWLRHRALDNTLLNISMSLPEHLRMPNGINDQNTIFTNLCIHTSTICLHQAAIFKADSYRLPSNVAAESKIRCITAAAEIASIMRMISHMDMSIANPFSSFCLYVAARVFVQYLKSRPTDNNVKASLHFLLTALQTLRRKNLLTESLLIQLDIDLQGAGLEESRSLRNRLAKMAAESGQQATVPECPVERMTGQRQTFGDNGLSKHTDPNTASRAGSTSQSTSSRMQSFSEGGKPTFSPEESFRSASTDFSEARRFQVPTRGKTPSTRPSPASANEEMMDYLFDGPDGTSPASFANLSSHTSNVSQTPPMGVNNNYDTTGTTPFDMPAMTNEEFQAMMAGMANDPVLNKTGPVMDDNMQTLFGSNGDDTNFTMPNFATETSEGHTGWTPMANGEMLGMPSDDLMQYLDPGNLDMGWPNGMPRAVQNAEALPAWMRNLNKPR